MFIILPSSPTLLPKEKGVHPSPAGEGPRVRAENYAISKKHIAK